MRTTKASKKVNTLTVTGDEKDFAAAERQFIESMIKPME